MQPRPFAVALVRPSSAARRQLGCSAAPSAAEATTVVQQAPLSRAGRRRAASRPHRAEIYKRDAPGVVFIRAQVVERTQSPFDLPRSSAARPPARASSSTATARSSRTPTSSTGATKVTVQFADKHVVDAKILGRDASTDLALLKVEPSGARADPLALGSLARRPGRRPDDRDRQPVRPRAHADDRRRLGLAAPIKAPNGFEIDNVIQTDARDQPRQLGRPAARRDRPRDRHQLADRDRRQRRRQRRHRLRDPDRHRQADAPAAQEERPGRPRLPRRRAR